MYPVTLLTLLSAFCFATTPESDSQTPPLGYWVTYNHSDPTSVIQMKKSALGSYYGVVVAGLYHGDSHPEAYCTECSDETWTGKYGMRKDDKVLGKSVLWHFKQEGNEWKHGQIIRIKSGNLFDASFTLADDNQALNMKVNAGFFKKTVTWTAITEEKLRQYCTHKEAYHANGKTMAIECIEALSKEPVVSTGSDSDTTSTTVVDPAGSPDVHASTSDSTATLPPTNTQVIVNNNQLQADSSAVDNTESDAVSNTAPSTPTASPTNTSLSANSAIQAQRTANVHTGTSKNTTPQDVQKQDADTKPSTDQGKQADDADTKPSTDQSKQADDAEAKPSTDPSTQADDADTKPSTDQSRQADSVAASDAHTANASATGNAQNANLASPATQQTTATHGNSARASLTGQANLHNEKPTLLSAKKAPEDNKPSSELESSPTQPNKIKTGSCGSHGHDAEDGDTNGETDISGRVGTDSETADKQGATTHPAASQTATQTT